MGVRKGYFEEYIALFPEEWHLVLQKKLEFKRLLEADKRLRIPARIWCAFLTPPDQKLAERLPAKLKQVWLLKNSVLQSFSHPRRFLETRDPHHHTNNSVTLALLEILYDLREEKVLLSREKYDEWLEVANHFGLWKLRYALEDAIFKAFDPENYELFESVIDKQMFIDTHLVQAIKAIIGDAFKKAGLKDFSIENRKKNIYGVYKKVALKDTSINDIYDIHGFRILTHTKEECYKAQEILHQLWPHFPERYKDYIASPKENGYASIHTVLASLQRKPIEFQIRTHEMDVVAASGPANHAEYKKSSTTTSS